MKFDIVTLRDRAGLTVGDATRDADLQVSLDLTIKLLETYLDRKLMRQVETETFTHTSDSVVSLHRYPIVAISTVVGTTSKYHFGADTGLVHFDALVSAHELKITYDGGFTTLPDDLAYAALLVFDIVWGDLDGGGGTVAAGTISSVTVSDIGTVKYATGAAATASAAGGTGAIPALALGILESYRRLKA